MSLKVVSWNIAAINNNPFEYWITHEDEAYNKLMLDVQEFIESPGEKDVTVSEVFTSEMWAELKALLLAEKWDADAVEKLWLEDFSKRKIIAGFMKDTRLGEKRFASMPDRVTNTINTADTGKAHAAPPHPHRWPASGATPAFPAGCSGQPSHGHLVLCGRHVVHGGVVEGVARLHV